MKTMTPARRFMLALLILLLPVACSAPHSAAGPEQPGGLATLAAVKVPTMAVPGSQGLHAIAHLLEQDSVAIQIKSATINAITMQVQNKTSEELPIDIPAGTYFVAKNPSTQNMVVRHSYAGSIPASGMADISLDVACANLYRAEPTASDTFSIVNAPEQPQLVRLMRFLDTAGASYAVEQAAVWIVTDNATYDELGILVGGSRSGPALIQENEAARAMMLVEQAGLDITRQAIWSDRIALMTKATEPTLIDWLAAHPTAVGGEPTSTPITSAMPTAGTRPLSQYAVSAKATSEYGADSWSAMQATGAPNSGGCGDMPTAWASSSRDPSPALQLVYAKPVIPTRVVIFETYNPGAVSAVELIDISGASHVVYAAAPSTDAECPRSLVIDVMGVDSPVFSVKISVYHGDNKWHEIDSVELIGRAP